MSYILLKQEQVTGHLKAAMKHVKAKSGIGVVAKPNQNCKLKLSQIKHFYSNSSAVLGVVLGACPL